MQSHECPASPGPVCAELLSLVAPLASREELPGLHQAPLDAQTRRSALSALATSTKLSLLPARTFASCQHRAGLARPRALGRAQQLQEGKGCSQHSLVRCRSVCHPQQRLVSPVLRGETPHTLQFISSASKIGLELKLQFGQQRQCSSNCSDCIQGLRREMGKLRVRNVLIKGLSRRPVKVASSLWFHFGRRRNIPGGFFLPASFPVHEGILSQGNY